MKKKYGYQSERLSAARRALMVPWFDVPQCFNECAAAFQHLDVAALPKQARTWIETITQLQDISRRRGPDKTGLWTARIQMMTAHERIELSEAVDGLAHWFETEEDDSGS